MEEASNVITIGMGSPSALSETGSTLTVFSRTPTPPTMSRSRPLQKGKSPKRPSGKALGPEKMGTKKFHMSNGNGASTRTVSNSEHVWVEPKIAPDLLVESPPTLDYTYIDEDGNIRNPERYYYGKNPSNKRLHPKLLAHKRNRTLTLALVLYYGDMPTYRILPIAGIIREFHFDALFRGPILTNCDFQEEGFHQRPSIKLIISDHLKAILVDDWENVTKNQQLVPLPAAHPVNSILADYLAFEKPKRTPGSPQADILEEVVAGLREYFDKCLGRILLYR
jgi:hypothetical protein